MKSRRCILYFKQKSYWLETSKWKLNFWDMFNDLLQKIDTEDIKVHKLFPHTLHSQLRHWTFGRSINWTICLLKKTLWCVKNCNRVVILTNYICNEDWSFLFCCFWSDILEEEEKVKWTDYSYSKSDSASREYTQYFIPFNVYKSC